LVGGGVGLVLAQQVRMSWFGSVLTDEEMMALCEEALSKQFPKRCMCCRKVYGTLRAYFLSTTRVGTVQVPDADAGEWEPQEPMGVMSFANCACGSTLAITSDAVSVLTMWRMLRWARERMKRRGLSIHEVRAEFVEMMRLHVLEPPPPSIGGEVKLCQ
jgi:hypothetical protein